MTEKRKHFLNVVRITIQFLASPVKLYTIFYSALPADILLISLKYPHILYQNSEDSVIF